MLDSSSTRRNEESEESGEGKREAVKEEASKVPGNGRRSERLECLERFHHLRLEAQWPSAYRASVVIRDDDDLHVFLPLADATGMGPATSR